jgi:hypothetical protein
MTIATFVHWLEHTPLSSAFQETKWVIPASQSVHILAVAGVMASVLLTNLRFAGLVAPGVEPSIFGRRYLRGVWWALPVLAFTGTVQIIAEPGRDLTNTTFWLKMGLLAAAVLITVVVQRGAEGAQESPAQRRLVAGGAWLAMGCWVAIVLCGRWIAYTYTP